MGCQKGRVNHHSSPSARESGDDEAIDFWINSRQRLLGERTRLDAAYTAELVPRAMSSNKESSSINEYFLYLYYY